MTKAVATAEKRPAYMLNEWEMVCSCITYKYQENVERRVPSLKHLCVVLNRLVPVELPHARVLLQF